MVKSLRIVSDALNANPQIRFLKNLRNAFVGQYFNSLDRGKGRHLASALRRANCTTLCTTISFNAPWMIDLLTAAWRKYSEDATLVVADNSTVPEAREAIRQICEARSVPYLALPRNPDSHPSRSHGLSLNWIHSNVVRQVEPEIFGFIDHDCFPVGPFNIGNIVGSAAAYGLKFDSRGGRLPGAWQLWPGYCFYRSPAIASFKVDFLPRMEQGLDTGGGNWENIYRRMPAENFGFAERSTRQVQLADRELDIVEIDGAFLHYWARSWRARFDDPVFRQAFADYFWHTHLAGQTRILATAG